jgi:hypothetical protein
MKRHSKIQGRHAWFMLIGGLALAAPAWAQPGLQGDWEYQQSCGWRHAAGTHLVVQGDKVSGTWSDGSGRGIGESGSLQGEVRNGKLYVHFCTADESDPDAPCTNFDTSNTDYYVLRGDQLDWYRQGDGDGRKYLTLHRRIAGKKIPTDDHCDDEQ